MVRFQNFLCLYVFLNEIVCWAHEQGRKLKGQDHNKKSNIKITYSSTCPDCNFGLGRRAFNKLAQLFAWMRWCVSCAFESFDSEWFVPRCSQVRMATGLPKSKAQCLVMFIKDSWLTHEKCNPLDLFLRNDPYFQKVHKIS